MIIKRVKEIRQLKEINKWAFLFGRRKTGKSFLISNFIEHDESFFIKNNRSILTKDNKSITYETFLEILTRSLKEGKVVVVDEFHRLDQDFFDYLHHLDKKGKLILISSTLNLSRNILRKKSALLGLFAEFPLGLIEMTDILRELKDSDLTKKNMLELAILLKEPITIDYFNKNLSARKIIANVLISSKNTIPALIGEVFIEESRELSAIYEGILRGIAIGKNMSGELATYLFSKRLIKKEDPSIITQYLKNLISIGLIEKIPYYNKKRFVYAHTSPLAKIFFYMDDKYNFAERDMSEKELFAILENIMPRIVEANVREEIAKRKGLAPYLYDDGKTEIDGMFLRFKKPKYVLEVKWGNVKQKDVRDIEKKLSYFQGCKKILFVPDKTKLSFSGELMDPGDLV